MNRVERLLNEFNLTTLYKKLMEKQDYLLSLQKDYFTKEDCVNSSKILENALFSYLMNEIKALDYLIFNLRKRG